MSLPCRRALPHRLWRSAAQLASRGEWRWPFSGYASLWLMQQRSMETSSEDSVDVLYPQVLRRLVLGLVKPRASKVT